MSKLLVSYINR